MPLLLLPNLLGEELSHSDFFPQVLESVVPSLDGLIAESPKGGRRFLKRFTCEMPIELLNEHSTELNDLITPLKRGETWGLISDVGLPVLADPGANLVKRLHELGIPVQAYPGPSSIVYALMLSGLSGQNFAFHGYLPRKIESLHAKLKSLEKRSRLEKQTQVMIEAPYRTERLFDFLLSTLDANTLLSVAWNLTLPTQGVQTYTIKEWKKRGRPSLRKVPAVFLLSLSSK